MEYSETKGTMNPILPLLFSNSLLPGTMNPPTEISPSTQLFLDKIHKLFDEFNRKLDKSEDRWERCDSESQAARAQRVAAVESHVDIPKRIPAAQLDAVVVADFMKVRDLDLSNAPAVAHNWGGLFDGGN